MTDVVYPSLVADQRARPLWYAERCDELAADETLGADVRRLYAAWADEWRRRAKARWATAGRR